MMSLQKSKHDDHVSYNVIYSILRRFSVCLRLQVVQILINFENFETQKTIKSLRNFVSRRANKAMLDQETENTETSHQIDISVASLSKQKDKVKKPNQGLKRPSQIEQEEINEAETQEELQEVTGQSDHLVTLT